MTNPQRNTTSKEKNTNNPYTLQQTHQYMMKYTENTRKKRRIKKMDIKTIKFDEIQPSEYNPRIMSEEEENKLRKNMKSFGLVDPIIINTNTNKIIGGHQRYNILQQEYQKKEKNTNNATNTIRRHRIMLLR